MDHSEAGAHKVNYSVNEALSILIVEKQLKSVILLEK